MVLISEAIRYLASSPQIQGLVNNKGWNTTIVVTFILSILGIIINAGAAIFLRRKERLFARLLKSLVISDLLVALSCGILWGLPRGSANAYTDQIFPRLAPYLVGISHMAVMTSNLLTGTLGFERFVRLNYMCNFRDNSWITSQNLNYYRGFCILFPIFFYLPKFYEIQAHQEHVDCYPILENLTGPMIRLDINLKQWEVQNLTSIPDFPMPLRSVQNYWQCSQLYHPGSNQTLDYFVIEATEMRKSRLYYKVYFMTINTIFGHLLPFAFIFVFNILVVRILRNVQHERTFITQATYRSEDDIEETNLLLDSFRQQSRKIVKSVSKRAARSFKSFRSSQPEQCQNQDKPITPNDFLVKLNDLPFIDEESSILSGTEKCPEPLPALITTLHGGALCHTIIKTKRSQKTFLKVESEFELTSVHDFISDTGSENQVKKKFVRKRAGQHAPTRVSFNNTPVNPASHRPAIKRHLSFCPETNRQAVLMRRQTIAALANHNGLVRHGSQAGGQVDRKLTWVCCYIMTMYMVSHIWKIIPNIYDALYGFDEDLAWPEWLKTIQGISHVMVVLNSTFNFLPYLFL